MGPHGLSAAVWQLPPFMSLSPLCFWIFDCKDMWWRPVCKFNSKYEKQQENLQGFLLWIPEEHTVGLVFQNLVLYNAV